MDKKLEPCPSLLELMCNNPCACCAILAEEGRIVPVCSTCKVTIMRKELERRAATESNEALTLDELREMDGEPVWVQTPGVPEYGRWVIVSGVDTQDGEQTLYCRGDYTCRDYGKTWLAYRRPPEGGEWGC